MGLTGLFLAVITLGPRVTFGTVTLEVPGSDPAGTNIQTEEKNFKHKMSQNEPKLAEMSPNEFFQSKSTLTTFFGQSRGFWPKSTRTRFVSQN